MEESNRNSMKLDIEAVRLNDSVSEVPKETYKVIPEYGVNNHSNVTNYSNGKNSNMVREKGDHIEDGANESMLGVGEKDKLALKDEVKFINGDHQNGDAKIDINVADKNFTGMTKEELMKFANDPFWVRLRWIFFILFWGLWIAMLAGAIAIIIGAPKCAAPVPLPWYKQGPLSLLPSAEVNVASVAEYKSIGAKGVIYSLPADETYLVHTPEIQTRIKTLVDSFKDTGINIIVDLTPNFVTKDDELFQKAQVEDMYRSSFVWASDRSVVPTNWLSTVNGTAWTEVKPQNFVLSQFGENRYDLQLNETVAKEKFKTVLKTLAGMGVKGFRVANAKHFIISKNFKDEEQSLVSNAVHTEYEYWTHTQTTFQAGLGQLLEDFTRVVKNVTNDEGFFSVTANIERPEAFTIKDSLDLELPIFELLPHTLATASVATAKKLHSELTQSVNTLGNHTWVQWVFDTAELNKTKSIGVSEYLTFLMLLPGVPVAPLEAFKDGNSTAHIAELEELRVSPSYMHGSFEVYTANNDTVIAYTRFKSGNPGYLVVYNPTEAGVSSDFSAIEGIPEQLTVHLFSKNYNVTMVVEKVKVSSNAVPVSKQSVLILTYVPK